MTPEHDPAMRQLVLAYEELEPAERAGTDQHLAGCAACRALRDALLAREADARARGTLSADALEWASGTAAAESIEAAGPAERQSLERLIERIERARPAPRPNLRPAAARRVWPGWWFVPAAAAAAAVLLWVRPAGRDATLPPAIERAEIARAAELRGARDRAYRTGDAFVLKLHLRRPGVPVVLVVDGAGDVGLLHPAGDREIRSRGPGLVVLPAADAPERWVFQGLPGTETFLTAIAPNRDLRLGALRAGIDALAREPRSGAAPDSARLARVESARRWLEQTVGPVLRLEVEHLP